MSKKKNKPERSIKSLKDVEQGVTSDYIGGDLLDELLSKLIRSVEVAKASRAGLLEKIWMKQQFYVGVNDVTRVLERMPATASSHSVCSSEGSTRTALRRAPLVPLQAGSCIVHQGQQGKFTEVRSSGECQNSAGHRNKGQRQHNQ
ncbi:unnamed protein product [Alopecurus aequalis]